MRSKASASFLKKRSKKLLLLGAWASAGSAPMAQSQKSLFASFSSEKEVLLLKASS
jgi:hypothetical protein